MRKRGFLIGCICFTFVLLLAGCGEQTQTEDKKEPSENVEEATKEIPKAARTMEEMIEQKEGILIQEHMDKEIEMVTGWNIGDYNAFYEETFRPIMEKELRDYFKENTDLTKEEVYDYLIYQIGSGQYKEYYDQLTNYEHGFEMPELPDGANQTETANKKMNAVVLIDASGSMKAEVSGGSKMSLAKETIGKFMEQMPEDANISLLAYGHVGTGSDTDKTLSCGAVESVYPLQPYDAGSFSQALNSFNASGWTPLAGAIEKSYELLAPYNTEDYYNIVYIVSDGIETCGGDPVAAAKKLQENNIQAKVNIIGFDVDDEGQQQLKQVADAGGGIYATVRDKSELETQVLKKWRPTIGQLVWTNGVDLKDTTDAMQRMNDIYNPLYFASDRERNRIKNAAYFLNDEKLISDETEEYVLSLADENEDIRASDFKAIKEEKEKEMWSAHKEINDKVKAWREEWEEKLGKDAYNPLKQ
ncbi:vWA domain-containing protein [Niallia endozanthoxylica]|uniref:VWA domain-containing protein n=1 Tax=Niallia endozanthoxylica TaxID=2036016 RepID=A0A5J5H8T4_9BACI|nr:VWA domain-containing protein [Niallia endozanthoxylica]KAA9016012.1 VWA domain-containing protein [Niallia endozanthoxylica]